MVFPLCYPKKHATSKADSPNKGYGSAVTSRFPYSPHPAVHYPPALGRKKGGRSPSGVLLGFALFSVLCVGGCHREIEGENIDLPPERPGRFIPEAAPAEARRAKEAQEREDRAIASGRKRPEAPQKPEEQYDALMPGNAHSGPLDMGDGHMLIPEAHPIYGKPPEATEQKPSQ